MTKYYKAIAINKTRMGDEWLSTMCQKRDNLGKEFIENVICGAYWDMCHHGCDCTDIEIRVGTACSEYGDGYENEIFTILMHSVEYGSAVYADVIYVYNDGFHFIRRMTIGK